MYVRDIMTEEPVTCVADTPLRDVAKLMAENDCGAIPVLERGLPAGIVTDRDIALRGFAHGPNPGDMKASDVMTRNLVSVRDDDRAEHAVQLMEAEQVHRLLVIRHGRLVGIVSMADLADHLPERVAGQLIREVSRSPKRMMAL